MKRAAVNEVMVGLAFVAGTAILGLYTIVVSKVTVGTTKSYVVDFDAVYGLKEGDAVRVEGHEVGEVKSLQPMRPEGEKPGWIRAVIQVSGDVHIYRAGSLVRVTPFSPLGGRVVEITRGKLSAEAGEYTYFGKAEGSVEPDKADVIQGQAEGELLQTLNRLVEDNSKDVRAIISNLQHVSAQLTQTNNVIGYLVNDPQAARDVDGVVKSLSSSAGRLDRILGHVEEGQGVVGGLLKDGTPLQQDVNGAVTAGRRTFESAATILERADKGTSALGVLVGDEPAAAANVRGIVGDVSVITSRIAAGQGTLGKLVHDDRLYEGAATTAVNLGEITGKINGGHGLLGVLTEDEAGKNGRETLAHLASITAAVDDPQAGTLGLLVHDGALRGRISRIAGDFERLVVEFRDSLEDAREQAPVNAFIGAVFAAF